MADITGTAASAAGAGIGAAVLALTGVEPHQLLAAFMGAIFGIGFAPEMGRLRAAATFVAVVVCAAILGKWGAVRWFDASSLSAAACAIGAGAFMHPAAALLVKELPGVLRRALGTKEAGQ